MSLLSNRQFNIEEPKPTFPSFLKVLEREEAALYSKRHLRFFEKLAFIKSKPSFGLLKAESFVFLSDHGISKHLKAKGGRRKIAEKALVCLNKKSLIDQNPQQGLKHYFIDVGLKYSFESNFNFWLNHSNKLVSSKVKAGTESFSAYPAMTDEDLHQAFDIGKKFIDRAHYHEVDLVFLSSAAEGGEGSALALLKALKPQESILELSKLVNIDWLAEELELIDKSFKSNPLSHEPFHNLCFYGGFEAATLIGAILRCSELKIPFVCSDLMASIMWEYAAAINPNVQFYGFCLDDAFLKLLSFSALSLNDEYPNRIEGESLFLLWALLQNELKSLNNQA